MFILEEEGKRKVVIFGDYLAGRVVKVLFAGPVPIALVDHDRNTGSVLRVLDLTKTDIMRRQVLAAYMKKFITEHGCAYNWTEKCNTDFECVADKISNLETWSLTYKQAIYETLKLEVRFIEGLRYHARNS